MRSTRKVETAMHKQFSELVKKEYAKYTSGISLTEDVPKEEFEKNPGLKKLSKDNKKQIEEHIRKKLKPNNFDLHRMYETIMDLLFEPVSEDQDSVDFHGELVGPVRIINPSDERDKKLKELLLLIDGFDKLYSMYKENKKQYLAEERVLNTKIKATEDRMLKLDERILADEAKFHETMIRDEKTALEKRIEADKADVKGVRAQREELQKSYSKLVQKFEIEKYESRTGALYKRVCDKARELGLEGCVMLPLQETDDNFDFEPDEEILNNIIKGIKIINMPFERPKTPLPTHPRKKRYWATGLAGLALLVSTYLFSFGSKAPSLDDLPSFEWEPKYAGLYSYVYEFDYEKNEVVVASKWKQEEKTGKLIPVPLGRDKALYEDEELDFVITNYKQNEDGSMQKFVHAYDLYRHPIIIKGKPWKFARKYKRGPEHVPKEEIVRYIREEYYKGFRHTELINHRIALSGELVVSAKYLPESSEVQFFTRDGREFRIASERPLQPNTDTDHAPRIAIKFGRKNLRFRIEEDYEMKVLGETKTHTFGTYNLKKYLGIEQIDYNQNPPWVKPVVEKPSVPDFKLDKVRNTEGYEPQIIRPTIYKYVPVAMKIVDFAPKEGRNQEIALQYALPGGASGVQWKHVDAADEQLEDHKPDVILRSYVRKGGKVFQIDNFYALYAMPKDHLLKGVWRRVAESEPLEIPREKVKEHLDKLVQDSKYQSCDLRDANIPTDYGEIYEGTFHRNTNQLEFKTTRRMVMPEGKAMNLMVPVEGAVIISSERGDFDAIPEIELKHKLGLNAALTYFLDINYAGKVKWIKPGPTSTWSVFDSYNVPAKAFIKTGQ
jgi:hypothetical protein